MFDYRNPDEIREFDDALGVVKYSFFGDADDSEAALHGAIIWHLSKVLAQEYDGGTIRPEVLPGLTRRQIDRYTFFGPRFDPERDALIRLGSVTLATGQVLLNPTYDDLGDAQIVDWRGPYEEPPSYTYAFTQTIHPLQLSRAQTQDLFRRIARYFIPTEPTETILDWSGMQLRDLSVHFEAGTETAYWGAYLYTIFDHASRQLTVISASTGP
jgi:hypothetical protein